MSALLFLGLKAFFLALVLTPICRDIFGSYRVVDEPNERRKVHDRPIPRVGGIAIAISYVCALLISDLSGIPSHNALMWKLLPGAVLVFMVGLLDDLAGLKPWQKLIGQLAAAYLAYWSGVRIEYLGGHGIPEWSGLPITILWLLICCNAINLVDGLDGLAAGIGLFATITSFVAALLYNNMPLAIMTFPLAASLLAFLCYNFSPATVFLGDCGSLLIGFLLGCYSVIWANKSATLLGMTAPLMALSLPLLDVALSIVRRKLRSKPIFGADRGHIHHRLLDRGMTPRRAVLVLYGICALGATLSLLQTALHDRYTGIIVVLFCLAAWSGVRKLDYVEFTVAGRLLFGGEFQHAQLIRVSLIRLEKSLLEAQNFPECWQALFHACRELGFSRVRFEIAGVERADSAVEAHGNPNLIRGDENSAMEKASDEYWSASIPLNAGGRLELFHAFNEARHAAVVAALADLLHSEAGTRLARLAQEPKAKAADAAF